MVDEEKYEILKKEVDLLQIQMTKEHGPWYTKTSNIIAITALLFSFGTTSITLFNSYQEDILSNRKEVRQILQRLSKLPIENFELLQKYKNSGPGQSLSSSINQENVLLATQAAELIERYPESFTSGEFGSVAFALANSNIVGKISRFYIHAIEKAETSTDYSSAVRSYAAYLFAKGDYSEGNKHYKLAMEVWDKFPEQNSYIVISTDLTTLMYWGQAALGTGNIVEARNKIRLANEKLEQLPPGPFTQSLATQLEYIGELVE